MHVVLFTSCGLLMFTQVWFSEQGGGTLYCRHLAESGGYQVLPPRVARPDPLVCQRPESRCLLCTRADAADDCADYCTELYG